ncbi:hypothetical protein ACPEEZ_02045 [Frigoribacterium sp. 2-23]|uniref:hypothetical protein n=1 Tax=Frigoribacterium sp. 2-23 TaxID=3415006 RepID=UPI003C6F7653
MDRTRFKMIAAVLTGVAVLALGFLLGVQPQLTAAAASSAQQDSVDQQNATLVATLSKLKTDNENLAQLKTELASKSTSVPSGAALPDLIRELNDLAVASRTTVTGFTSADAVAYAAPAVETPAPTAGEPASGSTSEPTAAPTAATPTAPTAVTDPTITAANFSSIAITVDIQGSYSQALDFVDRLQKGSRLFLVTTITSAEESSQTDDTGSTATGQTWTIGGLVFVLQNAAATKADQAADATPTTPASGAEGSDSTDTAAGR